MTMIRFKLDLAIPESIFDAIPLARKIAFRDEVRALKVLAVRINEGSINEEITVKATWHKCHHDEEGNVPCEPEQEV